LNACTCARDRPCAGIGDTESATLTHTILASTMKDELPPRTRKLLLLLLRNLVMAFGSYFACNQFLVPRCDRLVCLKSSLRPSCVADVLTCLKSLVVSTKSSLTASFTLGYDAPANLRTVSGQGQPCLFGTDDFWSPSHRISVTEAASNHSNTGTARPIDFCFE